MYEDQHTRPLRAPIRHNIFASLLFVHGSFYFVVQLTLLPSLFECVYSPALSDIASGVYVDSGKKPSDRFGVHLLLLLFEAVLQFIKVE